MGYKQATNLDQDLTLTKNTVRDTLAQGIWIRDQEWALANNYDSISLRVDNGKTHVFDVFLSSEVQLSAELANELKSGMNVSIAISSEEGNVYHTSSHLIGFTAAYNCVSQ